MTVLEANGTTGDWSTFSVSATINRIRVPVYVTTDPSTMQHLARYDFSTDAESGNQLSMQIMRSCLVCDNELADSILLSSTSGTFTGQPRYQMPIANIVDPFPLNATTASGGQVPPIPVWLSEIGWPAGTTCTRGNLTQPGIPSNPFHPVLATAQLLIAHPYAAPAPTGTWADIYFRFWHLLHGVLETPTLDKGIRFHAEFSGTLTEAHFEETPFIAGHFREWRRTITGEPPPDPPPDP